MTAGYGTMDYEVTEFRKDTLVKVDILINGEPVEALSLITHKDKAEQRGRQLLVQAPQADRPAPVRDPPAGRDRREDHRPRDHQGFRKDVTAKCYGGDVSRKRKLLEKQKKGKERMKSSGA
jgi:GTP-binding protein LepA